MTIAEALDVAEVIDHAAAMNEDAFQARSLHRAGVIDTTEALVRCLRGMVDERNHLIEYARLEADRGRDYAEDAMAEADVASDAAGRVADILGPR